MVRAIFTSLGLYLKQLYFNTFSLTCYIPASVTECNWERKERECESSKVRKEFIDSREIVLISLSYEITPTAHLFNDWQDQLFSFLAPSSSVFRSYIRPLFSKALNALVPFSLPQNWTTRENSLFPSYVSILFHGHLVSPFTILLPLYPPVLLLAADRKGSPPEIWDVHRAGDIVSHSAISRSSLGCNLWKASQSSPARVKRLLSLYEMNSRDAYGSYDVRAYALGVLKESPKTLNSARTWSQWERGWKRVT